MNLGKAGKCGIDQSNLLLELSGDLSNFLHTIQLVHTLGDRIVVQFERTRESGGKILQLLLGCLKGLGYKVDRLIFSDGVFLDCCFSRDKRKMLRLLCQTILQLSKRREKTRTKGTDLFLSILVTLFAKTEFDGEPIALWVIGEHIEECDK